MADQLQDIVGRMIAAGESEENIAAVIKQMTAITPSVSHGESEARPIATGGGRGTGLDVRKSNQWARDNAPAIGATLATVATGGGAVPMITAATLGGTGGGLLRGDDFSTAATSGAIEGSIQATMPLLARGGQAIARGLMKGTVPKNIAKEFQGQVDIPRELLDRGVVPGLPQSARRVEGLSRIANAERDAAAATVPRMNPVRGIRDLREPYQTAIEGAEPEDAKAILEAAKQAVNNMRARSPQGLTGPQQLTRKDIMQSRSSAALRGSEALAPTIANAQRSSIVSHLRETPRMARALDESQTLMAIDQVMKDAALGNPVTRMRIGGPTAVALTPAGFGMTAHAVNQGSRAFDPNVARLLMALMNQRSGQE